MITSLDLLSPSFRIKAFELLARCTEAGVPVMIINTYRTAEEQAANIAKGVSWTKNSKHLTGNAIDICPFEIYNLHGADKMQWDGNDPVWQTLGKIGEALGLRWGGRWTQKDYGHFERVDFSEFKIT
jgi:peptidoglycan L-alanyl-D-glutamate endopeptidase CwlK